MELFILTTITLLACIGGFLLARLVISYIDAYDAETDRYRSAQPAYHISDYVVDIGRAYELSVRRVWVGDNYGAEMAILSFRHWDIGYINRDGIVITDSRGLAAARSAVRDYNERWHGGAVCYMR